MMQPTPTQPPASQTAPTQRFEVVFTLVCGGSTDLSMAVHAATAAAVGSGLDVTPCLNGGSAVGASALVLGVMPKLVQAALGAGASEVQLSVVEAAIDLVGEGS
jgi:hypothetical protein